MSARMQGCVKIRVDRDGVFVSADTALNRRRSGVIFRKGSLANTLCEELDSPAVLGALPKVFEELDEYAITGQIEVYSFKIPTICFTPEWKRVEVAKILKQEFERHGWRVVLLKPSARALRLAQ